MSVFGAPEGRTIDMICDPVVKGPQASPRHLVKAAVEEEDHGACQVQDLCGCGSTRFSRFHFLQDEDQLTNLPDSWLYRDVPILELNEVIQEAQMDLSLARRLVFALFERATCQLNELLAESLGPTTCAFGEGLGGNLTATYPSLLLSEV